MIIRRLVQKRSIEIRQKEASDLRTARTYCVFGYRDILERRKAAGLEWVVRGRGVEFVHADTGHPLFRDEDLIIGRVTPGDAIASGEPPGLTAGESPDATASDPPAITAGPVERDTGKASEETSSSVAAVLRVLSRFGVADDDVAAKLISACRAHAVDCTPQEIVHFIERKGSLTKESHNSRIHRPIGFLLTAVPKCFVGEAFRLYREECRRASEDAERLARQQQAELEQWTREQEAVLADPNAPEEEKRFARELLGLP